VGPDLGAALGADVLQALHRLAELMVHLLLFSLPLPSLPPLVFKFTYLVSLTATKSEYVRDSYRNG